MGGLSVASLMWFTVYYTLMRRGWGRLECCSTDVVSLVLHSHEERVGGGLECCITDVVSLVLHSHVERVGGLECCITYVVSIVLHCHEERVEEDEVLHH